MSEHHKFVLPNRVQRGRDIDGEVVAGTPGIGLDMIRRKQLPVEYKKGSVPEGPMIFFVDQDWAISAPVVMTATTLIAVFSATLPHKLVKYTDRFASNSNPITHNIKNLFLRGSTKYVYTSTNFSSKHPLAHMLTRIDQTLHYLTIRHSADIPLIPLGRVLDVSLYLVVAPTDLWAQKRQTEFAIQARMEVAGHIVAARYQENGGDDRATDTFRSKEARVHITTNAFGRDLHTATITMMKFDLPLDKHPRPSPLARIHRMGPTRISGHYRISTGFANNKQSMYDTNSISNYFSICMRKILTNGIGVGSF
ncbi:hypothetical protein HOY80DRAFT_1136954 [Tuber brumale]|nr:hypothetical protein HOY80DRAFT_1136954 [Tuber brumale]